MTATYLDLYPGIGTPPPTRAERNAEMLRHYADGRSIDWIAGAFNLSRGTVHNYASKFGIKRPFQRSPGSGNAPKIRAPVVDPYYERDQELVRRYQSGENTPALSAAYNISRERVCQVLRRNNIIEHRNERRKGSAGHSQARAGFGAR